MKKLRFIGSSLDDLKDFPAEARRDAGFELDAIQRGLMPSDFKPMLNIGPGAYESGFMCWVSGESFTSPDLKARCTCCTRSRRRRNVPAKKTLIWLPAVTSK